MNEREQVWLERIGWQPGKPKGENQKGTFYLSSKAQCPPFNVRVKPDESGPSPTQHIHGKNPRQDFQPIANPLFPMRKISARLPILPAQKRPADAAVDHMKRRNLIVRKNLPPIPPWHRTAPLHPRPKTKHQLPRLNRIKTSVSFVK